MELMDYSFRLEPTGLPQITLNCIGNDDDIVTIQRVYNTGVWQGIGLSRPLDRAKEEMKEYILGTNNEKENKTMTAIELRKIEADAYEKGYSRGMETALRLE